MRNNNKIKQSSDTECDLINEEMDNYSKIYVPYFPQFKRPTYIKRCNDAELTLRSNVCSPIKIDDTVSISTKKSSTQSTIISNNYLVNHYIQQLKEHIGKNTRQEMEAQIIRNLIAQKAKANYMLDIKWAANYTAYLKNQNSQVPQEITNTNLFQDNDILNGYKQNLKQEVDYVLMNRSTWLFLLQIYGGGPEILYNDYIGMNNEIQILSRDSSLQNIDISTNNSMNFQKNKYIMPAIGLYNENNYCYMHAALQSLLSIEQMTCWMQVEGKLKKQQNYQWVQAYNEIIEQMLNCKKGQFIKLNTLKQLMIPKFKSNLQHDCQEFLCYLTEQLNKELKQNKYDQPITELMFQGQMMQQIQCQDCKQTSSKFESFFELSLSVNKMKGIMQCLKDFFAQEELTDEYKCNICNKQSKAIKKYAIGTPPQFLILHLKRFQINKLQHYIEFQHQLNLTEFCSTKTLYKLKSVIVHYGFQEKGHYVNFSQRGNQWFYFDDHRVQNIKEQDVLKQQAYILFYEKIEEQII